MCAPLERPHGSIRDLEIREVPEGMGKEFMVRMIHEQIPVRNRYTEKRYGLEG